MHKIISFFVLSVYVIMNSGDDQNIKENLMSIYVNQVGYQPNAVKRVTANFPCNYQVIDCSTQKSVYDGVSVKGGYDESAEEDTYIIDFSEVTTPGKYYILAGNGEKSCSFDINIRVYQQLQHDLMKALYYQRCGCELKEEHAGIYTHKCCHSKPVILFEDFVNKVENPTTYEMNGGWHDAGDFGRYIDPAGVAIAHLMYAYMLFPDSFQKTMNIPESGNGIPDILNECRYELEWMLKMQAPDGGVYHKLTSHNHPEFVMPEEDNLPFYIFPVSSMATADFAASTAVASRIYAEFDADFADKLLSAAIKAYDYLESTPDVGFQNPEGVNTGEYGIKDNTGNRLWAAAELLVADSSNRDFYKEKLLHYTATSVEKTDFGWEDVSGLATLCLLTDPQRTCDDELYSLYEKILFECADSYIGLQKESGFELSMTSKDFIWGSNMVVGNRGMLLALASILADGNETYANAAANQLHYLLGRNAMNVSYVTGEGENAFRNPHNRVTACDGIEDPMPGWVSGGPCHPPLDPDGRKVVPEGAAPQKCYADVVGSYSTNEITIYWNSPFIFLTAFLNQE